VPTDCAGITRNGNSLTTRWGLNPEKKKCPAPRSHSTIKPGNFVIAGKDRQGVEKTLLKKRDLYLTLLSMAGGQIYPP